MVGLRETVWPNQALQRTRPSRSGCNPRVLRAGSLSLGRSGFVFLLLVLRRQPVLVLDGVS